MGTSRETKFIVSANVYTFLIVVAVTVSWVLPVVKASVVP
jgi:hypothetical protein